MNISSSTRPYRDRTALAETKPRPSEDKATSTQDQVTLSHEDDPHRSKIEGAFGVAFGAVGGLVASSVYGPEIGLLGGAVSALALGVVGYKGGHIPLQATSIGVALGAAGGSVLGPIGSGIGGLLGGALGHAVGVAKAS